jgi:hypothetical protein
MLTRVQYILISKCLWDHSWDIFAGPLKGPFCNVKSAQLRRCWEDCRTAAAWPQWRSLTWCSSCRESWESAIRVDWRSETRWFRWSAGSCGRPLRECPRSRMALVGFPELLVLSCRLVFPYSSYKLLRLSPLYVWSSGRWSLIRCQLAGTVRWRSALLCSVLIIKTAGRSKTGTRSKTALWGFPICPYFKKSFCCLENSSFLFIALCTES